MLKQGEYAIPAAFAAFAGALCAGALAVGVLPWPVAVLPLAAGWWFLRRPAALLLTVGFLAVAVSFALREACAERLPGDGRPFAAPMELVVTDPRVSRAVPAEPAPRLLRAELRSLDRSPGGARRFDGLRVLIETPPGSAAPVYGTSIRAEGTVIPADDLLKGADGGFALRLKRQGAAAVVRANAWHPSGRETSVRSRLLDLRDALLERLFRGVKSQAARRLAAALYCGVSSGLSGTMRQDFAAAGIIHIFSVSGMHVAVLALCLGWLLRFLPFRLRGPALAIPVWLYVLGTGAGTPAVRAGAMITLWALLRMMLLRLPGIDILCWTATLLLVADPAVVTSPGAQYSFLITAALLLLARRRDEEARPFRSATDFVPYSFRSRGMKFAAWLRSRAKLILLGAGVAFLAGAGIALRIETHRLGTGAVAANILLALALPGYFALFFLQLAAGAFGAENFTAPLFEWAFLRLRDFAAVFGGFSSAFPAAPPHWGVAAVYTLALLTALRVRSAKARIAAWSVAASIGIGVLLRPFFMPPALYVRSGGSGRPAVAAVAEPARGRGAIVNLPDVESAFAAAEFLLARGIREVDLLAASSPRGVSPSAVEALRKIMPIRRIRPAAASSAPFGGAHFENPELHRDLLRVVPAKNGFRLEYSDPGSKLCFGTVVEDGDAGRTVVVEHRGRSALRLLPWNVRPESWEYGFDN